MFNTGTAERHVAAEPSSAFQDDEAHLLELALSHIPSAETICSALFPACYSELLSHADGFPFPFPKNFTWPPWLPTPKPRELRGCRRTPSLECFSDAQPEVHSVLGVYDHHDRPTSEPEISSTGKHLDLAGALPPPCQTPFHTDPARKTKQQKRPFSVPFSIKTTRNSFKPDFRVVLPPCRSVNKGKRHGTEYGSVRPAEPAPIDIQHNLRRH